MNYSELLQLAKSWGNFISDRIIIWRLQYVQNFEGKQNEISIEEGEAFIKRIAAGYNEIVYASIDEASITNRINDYIKSGNRPRANQWDFVLNADDAA